MIPLLRLLTAAAVFGAACAAKAADPAALAKRLHSAADASSLDDPALKPWHLKMTVQLFDEKGAPSEQGTIEEWWSPDADKRVYDTPGYKATEIRTSEDLRRTAGQPSPSYLLNAVRGQVVHPMATAKEIDNAKPELRVKSFGSIRLDCIVLDQRIEHISEPPIGLYPTYCLSQDKDQLRLTDRFGSEVSALDTFGTFQGRKVAVNPSIGVEGVKAVSAHVVTLESKTLDPPIFSSGDLEAPSGEGMKLDPKLVVKRVSSVAPSYPALAKAARIEGNVHVAITIGTDGHVHGLAIVDTPDMSLAISAMTAVRQWLFKPYLLNGVPREIDTVVTVGFHMAERM